MRLHKHKFVVIKQQEEKRITRRENYAYEETDGTLTSKQCVKCGITLNKWKKTVYYGPESRWIIIPHIKEEDFK